MRENAVEYVKMMIPHLFIFNNYPVRGSLVMFINLLETQSAASLGAK